MLIKYSLVVGGTLSGLGVSACGAYYGWNKYYERNERVRSDDTENYGPVWPDKLNDGSSDTVFSTSGNTQ